MKKVIMSFIKLPFYRRVLRRLLVDTAYLYSDKFFLKAFFWLVMGKRLDLVHPKSFSEKLQWLKLYHKRPEYTKMVDKIEAKKYVASIIGDEYIIPTIATYERVEDVDFDKLPKQFVIKCTHDSGSIVVCKNKNMLDKKKAIKKLAKGLKSNFVSLTREYPYRNVKPRLIAEQYIEDESGFELKDYKIFCFNG